MVDAKYTKFYAVHAVRQSNVAEANASYHMNEPGHEKMYLMSYANNKGAGQPAYSRSLISAFVVRYLASIISLDSIAEISRVELAYVAAQAGLCLAWSETPEDMLCRVVAQTYAFTLDLSIIGTLEMRLYVSVC